jgi:hypothetical protein
MTQQPWIFTVEHNRLAPADPWTQERLGELKPEVTYKIDKIARPRSLPFQGMYWATLNQIVKATGIAPTPDALHKALLTLTKRVTPVLDLKGNVISLVPDSTAFERMDQETFGKYVDEAKLELAKMDIVWEDYGKEVA